MIRTSDIPKEISQWKISGFKNRLGKLVNTIPISINRLVKMSLISKKWVKPLKQNSKRKLNHIKRS